VVIVWLCSRLVEFGCVGSIGLKSSCIDSWHAVGVKLVGMVLGLATSGMSVSVDQFWLQV
jgi:hypothetical protein